MLENHWHGECEAGSQEPLVVLTILAMPGGSFRTKGNNSMSRYRVSLSFTNLSDADLDEFAGNTIISLTGNTSFPTPSVPMIALTAGQTGFHSALLAAANGGKVLTATKNQKRGILEDMLRQEASYVQGIASQSLPMLLSSGFDANSTNQST